MTSIFNKKIFIILIIFVILVGFGFLLVYNIYQKEQTESQLLTPIPIVQEQGAEKKNGFKTYRNEEWGFEFEYPDGWEVRHSTVSDKNHVLALIVASTSSSIDIDFFINDWSKTNPIVLLLDEEVISELNVNGIIGYEYERISGNKKRVEYLFPRGRYWMVVSGEEKNREILQQIVTSLHFLSDTNIYRNEEFGFEFQYPSNWIISREHKSISYYSKLFLTISNPTAIISQNVGKKLALDETFLVNIVLPEFVDTSFWRSQKQVSSIIVGGVEGKKYEYEYQGFPHTTVILPLQDFRLILGTGSGSKPYLDEFNQILASFKFLK